MRHVQPGFVLLWSGSPVFNRGSVDVLSSISCRVSGDVWCLREWRNWQTRWLQVPVLERACGFKSRLAHQ